LGIGQGYRLFSYHGAGKRDRAILRFLAVKLASIVIRNYKNNRKKAKLPILGA
jgi:hypothetical protein